mmetsp:Transcript_121282/g.387563  ORF Transcript_121282/g.387563 Transcript_121282/m.387563 type:complete len:80 (+) Transcript_121282:758-997(+)
MWAVVGTACAASRQATILVGSWGIFHEASFYRMSTTATIDLGPEGITVIGQPVAFSPIIGQAVTVVAPTSSSYAKNLGE